MSILYNLSQCPSQTVVYLHRDSSGMRVANSLSVSDEQSLLKKYEREKANCGGFIQFGFCLFVCFKGEPYVPTSIIVFC